MVNRKRRARRRLGGRMHALTPKAQEAVTVCGVVDDRPVGRPARLVGSDVALRYWEPFAFTRRWSIAQRRNPQAVFAA